MYCVNPYSKCMRYTANCSKTNEISRSRWKIVTSRDIGCALEYLELSDSCKVGRKMTGGTKSFTMLSLAWIRGALIVIFHFWRACVALTQDLSTAFSSRPFNVHSILQLTEIHDLLTVRDDSGTTKKAEIDSLSRVTTFFRIRSRKF